MMRTTRKRLSADMLKQDDEAMMRLNINRIMVFRVV